MNKEHFTILLEDLYDKYNHTKKSEIPNLVEKYNGQEFDAVKTFYFKYNFRSHPNYDSKAGTDQFIKNIIEKYSTGERIIRDAMLAPSIEQESINLIKKETQEANLLINETSELKKDELLKMAEEKIKSIENIISDKEKQLQEMIDKMESIIQEKVQKIEDNINKIGKESLEVLSSHSPIKEESDEHIELKINLDYEESDIELPKEIKTMAAGTRFLILDQNKKFTAFEIKDIFCDYVSVPGKCIKEINIQKI